MMDKQPHEGFTFPGRIRLCRVPSCAGYTFGATPQLKPKSS
jgi:hypothetical protein